MTTSWGTSISGGGAIYLYESIIQCRDRFILKYSITLSKKLANI